ICFEPAGFPDGYNGLRAHATVQPIAGTTIALPVASLADVEHSKANRRPDPKSAPTSSRADPGNHARTLEPVNSAASWVVCVFMQRGSTTPLPWRRGAT
ncbi:MAG: hypothetical protein M3Y17_16270, partial [Actinomycetota bacterium]|nr:hypothetical protein [Actinomycetota bacterium]